MTPIPGKPLAGAYEYEKFGNIIIDDFIVEFEDGWRTWVCDKCKDFGSGSVYPYLDDRNQLMLFDIPYEQTDDYKYTYYAAQRHYEWYHKGEYKTTEDLKQEEARAMAKEIRVLVKDMRDEIVATEWYSTEHVSRWDKIKRWFGFEPYHGKHRREDFDDMPAVREVERQWRTWHQSVVLEYGHYPLDTWQGKHCFQSDIQLARGYYPFKRKKHRR